MQVAFDFGQTSGLTLVQNRLRKVFRPTMDGPRREPVAQLVRSLLGARTYDAVSQNAFERLIDAFPSWDALAAANPADIERIISNVTFADAKAKFVIAALKGLRARTGNYDLNFLSDWPVTPALAFLEQLAGVGRKVAAATLNFSTLRRPSLVIETHVLRVLKRLGFVKPGADIPSAYDRIMPSLSAWSADELFELHALLKKTGQLICKHDEARCAMCPLERLCPKIGVTAKQPFKTRSIIPMERRI